MNRPEHREIEELLAPFSMDAVDPDEAEVVELHLLECPRCRSTVSDFRDTAAHLAGGHGPAPAGVWDSIVSRLDGHDETRNPPSLVVPFRPRRRFANGMVGALAAAVLVIVALVGQLIAQGARFEKMEQALGERSLLSAALSAEADSNARRAELRSADGIALAHAVVTPDGTGFLRTADLRPLGKDRTYQLWAVIGTERISAGLLGPDPEIVPFRVAGEVIGLAVTDEAAGGVVASQNQPVATGLLVEA